MRITYFTDTDTALIVERQVIPHPERQTIPHPVS